mgnify:CR=1 FL=1
MVENVTAQQAWDAVRDDPRAQVVDVRTDAEWAYVGVPDLGEAGKRTVLIPWQFFPSMQVNGAFAGALAPLLRPDDAVWTHDFHLFPLGAELRRRGCRQRMGFFLHVPFPPHAVFSGLPRSAGSSCFSSPSLPSLKPGVTRSWSLLSLNCSAVAAPT